MDIDRYITVSSDGEEVWYDDYYEAQSAAVVGDLCIVHHTYELLTQEFVHHADHEPDDCER